jgi:hypothetical protein
MKQQTPCVNKELELAVEQPSREEMTAWDMLQRHCCLDADIALRCCFWSKDHHSDHIIIEIDNSAGALPDRPRLNGHGSFGAKWASTRLFCCCGHPIRNSSMDFRNSIASPQVSLGAHLGDQEESQPNCQFRWWCDPSDDPSTKSSI